ncbi:MAG TPA: DMT family transporter [Candidatus Limiplasma sp.]|nr:DMT family transporter [Candidatus Limiplasma sp.]
MCGISQATQGKLYLTGAFGLAGTSVVMGYVLSHKLGAFAITAISMAIVLVGLLPFYFGRVMQTVLALFRRQWLLLLAQAFLGIFLFRMFLLLGVRHTSTSEAGILTGAIPAMTAIGAYAVLKERPTAITVLGIAATVLGILLLQGVSLFSTRFTDSHWLSNLLVLLGAASETAFRILSRKQKSMEGESIVIHPMVQTLLVSAAAFCFSLIPALLEQPFPIFSTLGSVEIFALVWYGLVITALSFGFFYAGAKRCSAYTIAAFSGVMPLTSMLLSALFLHEQIGLSQWCGGLLVICGMLLIGKRFTKKAFRYIPGINGKDGL